MAALHTLTLTNGARMLAHSLTTVTDVYKTPAELLRAAHLGEKLQITPPKEGVDEWIKLPCEVEVTEAQRDLLKGTVTKLAEKIVPNAVSMVLLEQLGFE